MTNLMIQIDLWPKAWYAGYCAMPIFVWVSLIICRKIVLPTDSLVRYYGAKIPSIFNMFSQMGYTIIVCIVSGQCLATANEHLNATLGVVLAGVCTFVVCISHFESEMTWLIEFSASLTAVVLWIQSFAFVLQLGMAAEFDFVHYHAWCWWQTSHP
jgi:purine-cytosine permease-like protein